MGLTVDRIVDHPAFPETMRRQSAALIAAFEASPRSTSVFATQQRWLMAHVALAQYFRSPDNCLKLADFFEMIAQHKVASRNTADAFLKEMLQYEVVVIAEGGRDRRTRPIVPSADSLQQVHGWLVLHLATLDSLDGGTRCIAAAARDDLLACVQPLIADGLLASPAIREPEKTFSLFTWLNSGGLVMDRIIAGIAMSEIHADRIPTGFTSANEMLDGLMLSRGHLLRKLRAAEALGSLGWNGKRGQSPMWVSQGFWREYATAQAVKLAIIDRACAAVVPADRSTDVARLPAQHIAGARSRF